MKILPFFLKFSKLDADFISLRGPVEQGHAQILRNWVLNDCKTGKIKRIKIWLHLISSKWLF